MADNFGGPLPPPSPWRQISDYVVWDGGVAIPSNVTGGSKGPGTINTRGYYLNGVQFLAVPPSIVADANKSLVVNGAGFAQWGFVSLPLTGGTITGSLTIAPASAAPNLNLNAFAPTVDRVITSRVNNVLRWGLALGIASAESGGNAGSNFLLSRYSDLGVLLDNPLQIARSNGQMTLTNQLNIAPASGQAVLALQAAVNGGRVIAGYAGGIGRWSISLGDTQTEGTGNVGCNFIVNNYDNAGVLLGSPLTISRSTGVVYGNFGLSGSAAGTNNGVFGQNTGNGVGVAGICTTANGTGVYGQGGIAGVRSANGVQSSGGDSGNFQFRAISAGNIFGAGIHLDNTDCYLMSTASGDPYGTWSTSRPFSWNMATGVVTIAGNGAFTSINGALGVAGSFTAGNIVSSGGLYVQGGLVFIEPGGSDAYLNICDASQNGGQYRNLTIRGVDSSNTVGLNFANFTVSATASAFNGTIFAAQQINGNARIDAGGGFTSRAGAFGAVSGNSYNFYWSNPYLYAYVDSTQLGPLAYQSDYRIKKDVADLPSMWDRAKLLRPISYTICHYTPPNALAKEDGSAPDPLFLDNDLERWGFIAHELQETLILDAATGYKDSPDHIQSPNPWTMFAVLTKALQEAMARIEALEAAPVARRRH